MASEQKPQSASWPKRLRAPFRPLKWDSEVMVHPERGEDARSLQQRSLTDVVVAFSLVALYLALAFYQLGLPGLHYDEAKEAGVNAVELLTEAPVTAFRDATIMVAGLELPLMVQDYIGALNVYLALPFLWLTGIGVPNLRTLSILTALLTLITLERSVREYLRITCDGTQTERGGSRSLLIICFALLAASPSFLFWSRQGIFVTNITQPLTFLCIWQGLRWLRLGDQNALWISAFAGGLALYAKLLAIWIIGPFVLLAGGWWLLRYRARSSPHQTLRLSTFFGAAVAFALPLIPLLLFNWQTGGTISTLWTNLGQSYYGVNNADLLTNLPYRAGQLRDVLEGDHLWYLGGIYGNRLAPWLAAIAIFYGLWRNWKQTVPPLLLLLLTFCCSLFTVSDLFITHYALIQPLIIAVVVIALSECHATTFDSVAYDGDEPKRTHSAGPSARPAIQHPKSVAIGLFVLLWLILDLNASLRYHGALSRSGGLADHSDATYDLAYHLRYNGLGAPIALDWGLDAPIRYLSQGTVRPIEIFGYESPSAPDAGFSARVEMFLPNPDNVYLLRAPDFETFAGRREVFMAQAESAGLRPLLIETFSQRDGTPLFELWRVEG